MSNRRKAVTATYLTRRVFANSKVKQTHLTIEGVKVVVDGIFEELAKAILDKGYVNIKDFGAFDVHTRKPISRRSAVGSFGNGMMIEKPARGRIRFLFNKAHQTKMDEKIQKEYKDG